MPKILSPRFRRDFNRNCKQCHNATRKLCGLCNKCSLHCKCQDLPDWVERKLHTAFDELRTNIHKLAIESAAGEIQEENVYDALTKTSFEEIMTRHFPPPKEPPQP